MPREKTNAEERLENEGGPPPSQMIDEIDPTKDGRYRMDLRALAKEKVQELGRVYICTNYIIDENGVIADKRKNGPPLGSKNDPDWNEFQLIQSQADIILTSTSYFHRRQKDGKKAQDVFAQFDANSPFEKLGDWRENVAGLKRSPDVAVLSGTLDFDFPSFLTKKPRKLFIYTTSEDLDVRSNKKFKKYNEFKKKGATIIIAESENKEGKLRVDGKKLAKDIYHRGYLLAKNTAGPSILNTLLEANVLDLLYVTLVHKKLDIAPENRITIPINEANKKTGFDGFTLLKGFAPEVAVARDGTPITQEFLVYENKNVASSI